MKKYFKITILLVLSLMIFACEKIESINDIIIQSTKESESINFEGVKVKNGILCFDSKETMENTLVQLDNIEQLDREVWEKNIGFCSQKTIFSQIIHQEAFMDSITEQKYKNTSTKFNAIPESEIHPELYFKAIKKGIIILLDEETPEEYYTIPQTTLELVNILNEDGFYAIKDTLYQVKNNIFKTQKEFNIDNIDDLLNSTSSDSSKNIIVVNYSNKSKSAPISDHAIDHTSGWVHSGGGKSGEKRIQIRLKYIITGFDTYRTYTDNNMYKAVYAFKHTIQVECMERNWRRKWKYKNAETSLNGSWDFEAFEHGKARFHNSASKIIWPGNCTNSINLDSGDFGNSTTYYTIEIQPLDDNQAMREESFPPDFKNYTWTATRYGGDHGLTATISK